MSLKSIFLTASMVLASCAANAQTDSGKEHSDTAAQPVLKELTAAKTVQSAESEQKLISEDGSETSVYDVEAFNDEGVAVYPCPFGWSVIPNPSVDNSLTYENAKSTLSISVTSLVNGSAVNASPDAYARVASEQMNCKMPGNSNLIEDAFSFECPNEGVEAIVYGEPGELVLLVISGRNKDTEAELENFVKFLAYEAKNR